MLAALTAFVAAPLYKRARPGASATRSELHARRDVLLATLRELEIDVRAGVLDRDTYERARADAEAEAADVLRALHDEDVPSAPRTDSPAGP